MNNARMLPLEQITFKIGSGATPTGGKNAYKSEGISLIRSLNIYDFSFEYADLAYIDDIQAKKLDNVTLRENDVLINITGASVGRCCIVPSNVLPARVNQHVSILRPDPKVLNARYLLYCINSPKYKGGLLALAQGGATREALTKDTLGNFEIPVPSLPTQQIIASILSAYDSLIENNLRRIKILEEMVQRIYQEWFVHFRFPGHENVEMVESELGLIPEGWTVELLNNVCISIQSGGTPSRNNESYWDNGVYNWFKTKEFEDSFVFQSEEKIAELGLKSSSARIFPEGTILMAIYGATIGKLAVLSNSSSCNQAACGFIVDKQKITNSYLWYTLLSLRGYFKSIAQGAAQQNISAVKVKQTKFICAPHSIVIRFDSIVSNKLDLIRNLLRRNVLLRQSRDLLLPRLISGVLDVENIDIVIPEDNE